MLKKEMENRVRFDLNRVCVSVSLLLEELGIEFIFIFL